MSGDVSFTMGRVVGHTTKPAVEGFGFKIPPCRCEHIKCRGGDVVVRIVPMNVPARPVGYRTPVTILD